MTPELCWTVKAGLITGFSAIVESCIPWFAGGILYLPLAPGSAMMVVLDVTVFHSITVRCCERGHQLFSQCVQLKSSNVRNLDLSLRIWTIAQVSTSKEFCLIESKLFTVTLKGNEASVLSDLSSLTVFAESFLWQTWYCEFLTCSGYTICLLSSPCCSLIDILMACAQVDSRKSMLWNHFPLGFSIYSP